MFSSEIGWQSFCFHRMWIFEKKLLKCAIWYIFCTHSSLEMNFTCSLLTWKQSAMQATVVWGDSQLVPQFDAIQWAQPDLPWHSKKVNLVRAQHMGIGGNVRREWAGRTRKKKKTLEKVRVYSNSKRIPTEKIIYISWNLFYADYDPLELWRWGCFYSGFC